MRWIVWLSLVLVAAGWLAAVAPLPAMPEAAPPNSLWRRTCDGWERASWLSPADSIPVRRAALHPAVVAILEILLSVTAMAAFSKVPSPRRGRNSRRSCTDSPTASH